MIELVNNEIDYIRKELIQRGLTSQLFEDEIIDDIASAVESKMESGLSFNEASSTIMNELTFDEIALLNKKSLQNIRDSKALKFYVQKSGIILGLIGAIVITIQHITTLLLQLYSILAILFLVLTVVTIIFYLFYFLKKIKKNFFNGFVNFHNLFRLGIRVTLYSAFYVGLFLFLFLAILYNSFPNTTFHESSEYLFRAVMFTSIEMILVGSVISIIIGIILSSHKPKYSQFSNN